MIQSLVNAIKHSMILKGFLGLMVLSFGVWGIGDVVSPSVDPNIAIKSGSFEVRATELQRRFSSQVDQIRANLGNEAARDQSLKQSIIRSQIEELSRLAAANLAADELGVVVTPERIRNSVIADDTFHDETGNFSQLKFQQILAQNGLDEQRFTALAKNDMTQQVLLRPVAVGAWAPEEIVDRLFAYRTETRVADTILVSAANMEIPEAPTDEQLQQIYDDNIGTFTAPEYRKIEAVVLMGEDLIPLESVSMEEAREYYNENTARYGVPEKRRIAQLLFETRDAAEAALALAQPGDGLAALADKAGVSAPIDLGERTADDPLLQTFGDTVKGLLAGAAAAKARGIGLAVCPPAPLIAPVAGWAKGSSLAVGGQDCHAKPKGAHTGDTSAELLKELGCRYVIVGHSERRADHGETDSIVHAKAKAALAAGLTPIICVGETQSERDAGQTEAVVKRQLAGSVPDGVSSSQVVIAYEPVWAIGTGRTPTATDIERVHDVIRASFDQAFRGAADLAILYGGSVKGSNAAELMAVSGVDGALVGGASLDAADFLKIADSCPK